MALLKKKHTDMFTHVNQEAYKMNKLKCNLFHIYIGSVYRESHKELSCITITPHMQSIYKSVSKIYTIHVFPTINKLFEIIQVQKNDKRNTSFYNLIFGFILSYNF